MAPTAGEGCAHRRLLAEYDSDTYGPLFAVSDEGSAGPVVVDAAYASAKAAADPSMVSDPMRLGVILDGERMTSAGELPIGPPEYAALSAAAAGRLLLTTNVGTRVNVRLTGPLREFAADDTPIHLCGPEGVRRTVTMGELLPMAFGPDNLRR